MAFEAELTTTFARVAAQGERLKNSFDKMNAGNLRAARDYVATLKKAEQLKLQQFGREFRTDQGLSSPNAVARMNAAIDAQQAAAFRSAGASAGPAGSARGAGRGSRSPGVRLGEGPLARFANRAAEAAGVDLGAIPGLGVAVAGIAVAGKALLAVDAQRVAMAKEIVRLEQQRGQAIHAATVSQEDAAKATGERLGQKIETLVARGGSVGDVKDIAMRDGRDLTDVIEALTKARDLKGVDPRQAVAIARRAAQTGEVSMSDAMDALRNDPALRFAAQQPGVPGEMNVASRILANKRGNVVPSANDLANIQLDIMRGMGQYGDKDPLTENVKQQRRIRTQTELAGLSDVEKGLGVAGARTELSTTVDRVGAALVELNRQQELNRAQMKASADAQGAFAAGVQNFLMILGGEGSEEQKRRRFENANARALFNAPGR
jgi:hypothetical protein